MNEALTQLVVAAQQAMDDEKWVESSGLWSKVISLSPENHHARYNLARCYWQLRQISECLNLLSEIPPSFSGYGAVLNLEAVLRTRTGEHARGTECYRAALELLPDSPHCWSNYLLSLHYQSDWTAERIAEEHRNFGQKWDLPEPERIPEHALDLNAITSRKLRIGFLSADLRLHSVAYFLEPVVSESNRDHFEIFLYSIARQTDAMTDLLRERADHFREISNLDLKQREFIIRSDDLDILVELGGHTENNALPLMARKPASIQVSWLGYPHSSGMKSIDYRFSDARIEPLPEFQSYSAEQIFHIPEGCHCYRMPGEAREVGPLPMKHRGHPTFICCNDGAKISDTCLDTWAQLLQALPEAHLILKNSSLFIPGFKSELEAHFATFGVDKSRLDLRPLTNDFHDHLATYSEADIALDTFPYNGTTTTCEAFWCGLPVLTLAGNTVAGRHGISLVEQVDLSQWVAHTREEYIEKARIFASDADQLEQLRITMRSRLAKSSLGDNAWMARRFEYSLMSLWISHHESQIAEPRLHHLRREIEGYLKAGRIAHWFRAGLISIQDCDIPGAVRILTQAAESGSCPQAWVAIGRIATATNDPQLGQIAWKHASEAFPDQTEYQEALENCINAT